MSEHEIDIEDVYWVLREILLELKKANGYVPLPEELS